VIQNRDLDATWKYHNATKHSYQSLRINPHFLDWENKPLLFKIYPTLEVLRLPKDFRPTGVAALAALATSLPAKDEERVPSLDELAQLLLFSAGVTKSRKFPGGEMFFRAAACTGALYEIELYVVCQDLPGLAAGVYHFGAAEFGLRQLRAGDFRQTLVDAAANEPSLAAAPVLIISTGTYWRNAWKYRSRTYRHFGWDNGTILANLLTMTSAMRFPAQLIMAFVDAEVNALLDVDLHKEVALSMVALGHTTKQPPASPPLDPLQLATVPYSREEVDYPAMRQMHESSSLGSAEEVAGWRASKLSLPTSAPKSETISLALPADAVLPADTVEQVIQRRGSTRQFAREAITLVQLAVMLDRATRPIPRDTSPADESLLNQLYLIVHAVEGLKSGAYFYHQADKKLELLKQGDFRKQAGYLGLEQQIPADASVDVFFLADLQKITAAYGNRGYRTTQLEAGLVGGRLYLAAYAQRLGASGLTFYDDDVVNFFSPHAKGKNAIFLVALGKSAKVHP
jgi:SagB-type dehydrogenase family enzyme